MLPGLYFFTKFYYIPISLDIPTFQVLHLMFLFHISFKE